MVSATLRSPNPLPFGFLTVVYTPHFKSQQLFTTHVTNFHLYMEAGVGGYGGAPRGAKNGSGWLRNGFFVP